MKISCQALMEKAKKHKWQIEQDGSFISIMGYAEKRARFMFHYSKYESRLVTAVLMRLHGNNVATMSDPDLSYLYHSNIWECPADAEAIWMGMIAISAALDKEEA